MNINRNFFLLLSIFLGIILFFFAITTWWLALANPDLMIWSILLFFVSILFIFNSIIIFIFDIQKRLEKIELIYKIRDIEASSTLKSLDIKIISLNNWEKRIITHLKDNGGELTQIEIKELTGLSRSNLSKHINNLAEKNIIHREPFERTNKIILIKNILD